MHSETFYCCQTFQNPRIRLCGFKKLETGFYCGISGMHICTMGWLDLVPINLTSGSVRMELGFDHVQNRNSHPLDDFLLPLWSQASTEWEEEATISQIQRTVWTSASFSRFDFPSLRKGFRFWL